MIRVFLYLAMAIVLLRVLYMLWDGKKNQKENNRLEDIQTLAEEGETEKAFNLAQEWIEKSNGEKVLAKYYYWQAFCLFKRDDLEGTRDKLRLSFEINPMFDRLDENDDFREICAEVRNGDSEPLPGEMGFQ